MANINLPEISTGNVIESIAGVWIGAIQKNFAFDRLRPVFLWGPPGVGKSDSICQIADKIKEETGKTVEIRDIRLSNCALTDLVGIPTSDKDKTKTVWLRPQIFDFEDSTADVCIVFFDELEKASPSVQAAALQIILNRTSWVHKLPENCLLIAAGNPSRMSKSMEAKIRPELANRFRHYLVMPDFDSFRAWGIHHNLNPYVLGYLSFDNSRLYQQMDQVDEVAFPTPRSWKNVSDLLELEEGRTPSQLHYDIAGDVGVEAALEFEKWCEVFQKLPSTQDIFAGKNPKTSGKPDIIYALISSMTTYITSKRNVISEKELQNACDYVVNFPEDFQVMFFFNLVEIEEIKQKLAQVPIYMKWYRRNYEE